MKQRNGVLTLIRVLLHNAEMRMPDDGKRKGLYTALGAIAVLCIMIPCCGVVGYISYMMTASIMIEGGQPGNGLLSMVHIMSAFSMIFGILVIFNVLFFSSDREHLVPLPLKPEEIMTAKFFYAYFAESVMEFMVLLAMFIGFTIAYGPSVQTILGGVIGTLMIPLLPLTYCGIISILLMGLLRKVRSSKFFGQISTALLLLFVALFLLSFRGMGEITVENYISSLSDGSNLFLKVLNGIFFTNPFLMKTVAGGNILYLLAYLAGNAAVLAVMVCLGHFLYQDGLYTVGILGGKSGKRKGELGKKKAESMLSSYLKKEWKVLMRTKAYRVNCVLVNALWPIAVFVIFMTQKEGSYLAHIFERFSAQEDWAIVLVSIVIAAVAFIASAMNSVASTSFTREGAHLALVKYIPVSYSLQAKAKGLLAVLVSFVPLYVMVVIAGIFLHMQLIGYLYFAVLLLTIIIFTTILGMVLDSTAPHSDWDDEYSALRGNLNTFFNMAIVMVLAGIICGGGFLLYYYGTMSSTVFLFGMLCTMLVVTSVTFAIGRKKIMQNMDAM